MFGCFAEHFIYSIGKSVFIKMLSYDTQSKVKLHPIRISKDYLF